MAALMGALSAPTRIRVVFALVGRGEMAAGELAKAIGMSSSATSHQLRVLRDLGLVSRRREGRAVTPPDVIAAVIRLWAEFHRPLGRTPRRFAELLFEPADLLGGRTPHAALDAGNESAVRVYLRWLAATSGPAATPGADPGESRASP